MYLVSVYFDDKSNKIISDYINKIAQKTGNTFMTDNHVPPHLTIMSVEAREEDKLTEVMGKLERYLTKGQIQLVSVGVLLPYVLYVTPVLNLYLEDISPTFPSPLSIYLPPLPLLTLSSDEGERDCPS